jgi:hypothetical protein
MIGVVAPVVERHAMIVVIRHPVEWVVVAEETATNHAQTLAVAPGDRARQAPPAALAHAKMPHV